MERLRTPLVSILDRRDREVEDTEVNVEGNVGFSILGKNPNGCEIF
jgi:hypothetical protein